MMEKKEAADLLPEISERMDGISLKSQGCQSRLELNAFAEKIVLNPIIHEIILSFLTPLEILLLARTCRIAHDVVQNYIPFAFNIDRILSRYFTDPLAFRALQARTGTLISGSSALQFFARTVYPKSDLDLYISPNQLLTVVQWLVEQGYTFIPRIVQPASWKKAVKKARRIASTTNLHAEVLGEEFYTHPSICAVLTLVKPSSSDPLQEGSQRKIQCVVGRGNPMRVILAFHSSKSRCYVFAPLFVDELVVVHQRVS